MAAINYCKNPLTKALIEAMGIRVANGKCFYHGRNSNNRAWKIAAIHQNLFKARFEVNREKKLGFQIKAKLGFN